MNDIQTILERHGAFEKLLSGTTDNQREVVGNLFYHALLKKALKEELSPKEQHALSMPLFVFVDGNTPSFQANDSVCV